MSASCKLLDGYMKKPVKPTPKKVLHAIAVIQREWFKASSQKNANPHQVEDYLDEFEEISHEHLAKVVNMADNNGNTALHYSVSHGNFDIVSLLLDSKVCDVNRQNKAGYTAIMLASLAVIKNEAHRSVIQRLFSLGDVNIRASQHGQTALMLAVSHGRLDLVRMLLEAGAEVNIKDVDGSTALMCASEHGHMEIVKLLLAHPDCDPSCSDNDGSSALSIAVANGHRDIGLMIYARMSLSRQGSPLRKMSPNTAKSPLVKRTSSGSDSSRSGSPQHSMWFYCVNFQGLSKNSYCVVSNEGAAWVYEV
ncbi:PREDICTED: KN motif and ankyrin repeat domain-containing protein 1-like [Priapulus caudatus]|uniref:KN motif and ankyrin repeat domain-containing protein 1-like n=1 Tax=Priapulus caudatus TaxID=37621 RepID=A0ABM1E8F0_PRICU|nr:PREDICTED: KN motif and ankyrin repeat domain-containing protein 1-like [Priapulus caudatus]